MPAVTIRNLSPETHRALRIRAAEHGRSTEAEIRAILDEAARPADRLKMGTALVNAFRAADAAELDLARDPSPAEPAVFE
jgi:plasmid stability protein